VILKIAAAIHSQQMKCHPRASEILNAVAWAKESFYITLPLLSEKAPAPAQTAANLLGAFLSYELKVISAIVRPDASTSR
jgi:hypothetical protein